MHRAQVRLHRTQDRGDLGRERQMLPQAGAERIKLRPVGQVAVPQQVDDLLERGMVSEFPDVIPPVDQLALLTIDEADPGSVDLDTNESAVNLVHQSSKFSFTAAGAARKS